MNNSNNIFNREIENLEHWNSIPEGANITKSFGYSHTMLYGRKRGNKIIGDIWYLNHETGAWSPSVISVDVIKEDKFGTLHFYKAVR